jgi:hypothetical protein
MAVGWGNKTWGEETWGDLSNATASPNGISANLSIGTSTTQANANVDVTGSQLTFTNAGAVAGASADVSVTGIQGNLSIGEEDIARGIQQDVTGSQLTTTPGAVTIDDNFLIGSGWGRDSWGSMVWGDAYSAQTGSVSATISVGAVAEITAGASASPTGQELTATPGQITMTGDANIDVTGIQATLSVGEVQVLSVVGSEMTISIRPVDIEAGGNVTVNVIDDNLDTEIGQVTFDIGVTAAVTGFELTSSIGDETVTGTANVELTNFSGPKFSAEGNAALSTDQAKFGVSSLELDGTDDSVDSTTNLDLSSTDFTVDVWIRPNNVTGYKGIWQSGTSTTMQSYLLGNAVYWSVNPSTIITTAVTVNANEWTMLSYERQGTTHRIYKNGTLEDTATTGNKQDNGPFSIGENGFGDFNGYIDEFRLSDTARYGGSSFTEPTGAFVPDSNTTFLLHMDGANGSTNILDDAPGVTIARFDIGEAFGGEVVEVQVTTASAQPWGELTWGDGEWGQSVGTDISIGADTVIVPSVEVDVTGIALNSTAATVSVTADANLSLTGQEVELLQGNENAFSDVTIEVSGQELTTELENVVAGISVLVLPTGVTSTTSTGIMGINAWAVVDPNASTTWSVVDKAAA